MSFIDDEDGMLIRASKASFFFAGVTQNGRERVGLRDGLGRDHWTTPNSVEIIDPTIHDIPACSRDGEMGFVRVTVTLRRKARSGKAWEVNHFGNRVWLPVSQVPELAGNVRKNQEIDLTVPKWLAQDKGLVRNA